MEQQALNDSREYGVQPFDALMKEQGFDNHTVVAASPDHITHKMVSKARNGRFLSVNVRRKVLMAFNIAAKTEYKLNDLFNY